MFIVMYILDKSKLRQLAQSQRKCWNRNLNLANLTPVALSMDTQHNF